MKGEIKFIMHMYIPHIIFFIAVRSFFQICRDYTIFRFRLSNDFSGFLKIYAIIFVF